MILRRFLLLAFMLSVYAAAQNAVRITEVEPLRMQLWAADNGASMDVFRPLAPISMDTLILIVPGGGFVSLSPYDRLLAEFFRQEGYPAAVVNYRVLPARYTESVADVMRAIRLLRTQGTAWGITVNRIAVLGESAGGMLAAITATQPALVVDSQDGLASTVSARPDLLILLSPVISAVAANRYHGVDKWIGADATQALRERITPELHVPANAPPAILFHAADDPVVPYEGTLDLARAYWKAGAPAELHLFPSGGHGHAFYDSPAISQAWRQQILLWLSLQSGQPRR
jgi:acetyl esterase/lipase